MDGIDEENCDKLEFHECDENEYRCANGMCIPEEYFLDGYRFFFLEILKTKTLFLLKIF